LTQGGLAANLLFEGVVTMAHALANSLRGVRLATDRLHQKKKVKKNKTPKKWGFSLSIISHQSFSFKVPVR